MNKLAVKTNNDNMVTEMVSEQVYNLFPQDEQENWVLATTETQNVFDQSLDFFVQGFLFLNVSKTELYVNAEKQILAQIDELETFAVESWLKYVGARNLGFWDKANMYRTDYTEAQLQIKELRKKL